MLSVTKPATWFIILIIGFPQLSETIFAPLLPFIVDKFQTTQTLSQLSMSLYFLGFAFGVLFLGSLSDQIGRKKTLLYGIFCYSFGSFALFLAHNIYSFLGFRVLQAFGAASGSIVSQTILRECFTDAKERVKVFASVSAALSWTPALGPLLGGQLVAYMGIDTVFVFLTLLGIGIFFCSMFVLQEVKVLENKKISFLSVVKRMISDPQIYINIVLVAGFNTIIFSIYAETPFVFMETFEWSPKSYSFIGVGMALCSVFGAALSKNLAYRGWSTTKRIRTGLLLMCFTALLYILPSLLGLSNNSAIKMTWMLIALSLTFVGVVIALPGILGDSLNPYRDCIGTAGALFGFLYYLVLSLFLGLISRFSSESLTFMGEVILVISVTMLFLTIFVRYKTIKN